MIFFIQISLDHESILRKTDCDRPLRMRAVQRNVSSALPQSGLPRLLPAREEDRLWGDGVQKRRAAAFLTAMVSRLQNVRRFSAIHLLGTAQIARQQHGAPPKLRQQDKARMIRILPGTHCAFLRPEHGQLTIRQSDHVPA